MLGGGVAGAIERAGGQTIQQECDVWTELYGKVPDGQCGLSHGGNMSCKYVKNNNNLFIFLFYILI